MISTGKRLEEALSLFESNGFLPFQKSWQARSLLNGKTVIVEEGPNREEVLVQGIDAQGFLKVAAHGKERLLVAG